jgi:HPt (histidine-containing phosphotransfer) domain-containing protein
MPDSNKDNRVVNMEELNEIMDNDMELIQDCFADFLSDLPVLLGDIQKVILQKNFQGMDESAHKLKGTLKYLAAEPAADAAMAIEKAGRNVDPDNLDEKFSTLETECQKVAEFIKGFQP